jgi:hypothetical protein
LKPFHLGVDGSGKTESANKAKVGECINKAMSDQPNAAITVVDEMLWKSLQRVDVTVTYPGVNPNVK